MFAMIYGVICAFVSRDRGVAIDPHFEVRDLFPVDLVVLAVLHVSQDRLFRFPVAPARSTTKSISVVFLDVGRVAGSVRLNGSLFHFRDHSDSGFLSRRATRLSKGQYAEGRCSKR